MVYVDDSGYEASNPKRVQDQSFERTVTDTGLRRLAFSDQRPPKRIKADQNEWINLRAEKLGPCRTCDRVTFITLHHILGKSLGGDDVADNLVPLCGSGTTGCHGKVENREPWTRSLLGQRLTDAERAYVVGKKGAGWLEIHYGVKEDRAA